MGEISGKKAVIVLVIIALIAGLMGGVFAAALFTAAGKQGIQGEQGPQGPKGDTGATGPAGATGATGPQGAAGASGATGATGATGPAGPAGAAGANGSVWWNGTGTPALSLGSNGDFYLDLASSDVYNKVSGSWTKVANIQGATGPSGPAGPPGSGSGTGSVWLNGTGMPASSLGSDGDFYLDLANSDVYNKISGSWTKVANIKGATGATGATGETGPQGPQGPQGVQGIQGPQGADGKDSVLQIIRSQNATDSSIGSSYAAGQWYNMMVFDSSMRLTINVQDQSRIYAEFLTSVYLANLASMRLRIVIDNQVNSIVCTTGIAGPNSAMLYIPAQVKILTDALSAGQHTIDVQFLRDNGTPVLLARSLYVTELASP